MDKKLLNNLLIRLVEGDNNAFNDIYNMTSNQVFAVIFGIVQDKGLAQDLTHDTFIKVKQNIGKYKPNTNGQAWILTIGRNIAINEYRRRKREVYTDFGVEEYKYAGSYEMDTKETPTLDLAKKVLKENEFEVLYLYLVAEMKHKEIAAHLGKPLGTVLWLYNTALGKLRKYIADNKIDL